MEMNSRALRALALLGALLAGSTTVHASETLNTILGGGAGGVAATANKGNKNEAALGGAVGALGGAAIGKSVGGDTGQLIGAGVGGASGSAIGAKTGDGHKSPDRYYDDDDYHHHHKHHKKYKKHKKHRWHDDD